MIKLGLLLVVLSILFLSGCSIFISPHHSRESLLLEHLQGWQNFKLEGIAEITFGQFRLRRSIHILRNRELLNVSLLESGLFGLRPTPMFSIEIDSTLTISLPKELRETLGDIPEESELLDIDKINSLITSLEVRKDHILKKGRVTIKQAEFVFTDKMQFDHVTLQDGDRVFRIDFNYRRDETLTKLVFSVQGDKILEISVDRIRYGVA